MLLGCWRHTLNPPPQLFPRGRGVPVDAERTDLRCACNRVDTSGDACRLPDARLNKVVGQPASRTPGSRGDAQGPPADLQGRFVALSAINPTAKTGTSSTPREPPTEWMDPFSADFAEVGYHRQCLPSVGPVDIAHALRRSSETPPAGSDGRLLNLGACRTLTWLLAKRHDRAPTVPHSARPIGLT